MTRMEVDAPLQVFRVTVRGRFTNLTTQARHYLVSSLADHDVFLSRFSEEGTFTYDTRIDFFNLRYEVRGRGENAEAAAIDHALLEAELFLDTMTIGFRDLRPTAMNMSAMWKGDLA